MAGLWRVAGWAMVAALAGSSIRSIWWGAGPGRRLIGIGGGWIGIAGAGMLAFRLVGAATSETVYLIGTVAAAASVAVASGIVCLSKGRRVIGIIGVTAWATLPVGFHVSSAVFTDTWAPALAGSVLAVGVILVAAVISLVGAIARARPGSEWVRHGRPGGGDAPGADPAGPVRRGVGPVASLPRTSRRPSRPPPGR